MKKIKWSILGWDRLAFFLVGAGIVFFVGNIWVSITPLVVLCLMIAMILLDFLAVSRSIRADLGQVWTVLSTLAFLPVKAWMLIWLCPPAKRAGCILPAKMLSLVVVALIGIYLLCILLVKTREGWSHGGAQDSAE